MNNKKDRINRRSFIKASGAVLTGTLASPLIATAAEFKNESLQTWSCGGLAEAFIPASKEYEVKTGCNIAYTGAFAAALGKSLLGSATTEVLHHGCLNLHKNSRVSVKCFLLSPCVLQNMFWSPQKEIRPG